MEKLILLSALVAFLQTAYAVDSVSANPAILKKWTIPSDHRINKKRLGGLSGCSVLDDKIYFVSDDRGGEGGPRIFKFNYDRQKNEIDFTKNEVISVKADAVNKLLDLEGIAVLSPNRILLSSEGDLNQKPRLNPYLFWINAKGEKISSITVPDDYLPEKSGQQTKGVQNNLAFEGLVLDSEQKKWAAMLEGALFQDQSHLKLVESSLDSIKFDTVYTYPLPKPFSANPEPSPGLSAYFGVSDILFLSSESYLILERGVQLGKNGLIYRTQLCQADKTKTNELTRRCFYSMNDDESLKTVIPSGANFEGLCWVDKLKKQFIAVSDNNFSKGDKTIFVLYQLP